MAGAGVFAQPVVGLTNIICLINRFPHLAGKAVFASSADLFIPYLHGFPTGGAVDNAVEQVVEGAGIAFHNRWPAIHDGLYLLPFLRCHNRLMAALNDFPVLTGNDVIGVGANPFLVCPANQMSALIKRVSQDMADSCAAPRIVIDIAGGISFYSCDGNLVFHQLLGNPHTAPAIQCQVIDFANHRRSLRVKDQMPPILRVTHQPQGRLSATELSLSGTGHTPRQHFLGNIPAIHIVQDILERRDVHFLTGQTVHAIRNGDIADIVFREEDFNIATGFDIISSQSGQVFGNDTTDFTGLNIGNHPLKSRTIE